MYKFINCDMQIMIKIASYFREINLSGPSFTISKMIVGPKVHYYFNQEHFIQVVLFNQMMAQQNIS